VNYLTTEQVLFLHFRLIVETGGCQGIINLGLLESAVGRPQATFAGTDLYPDVFAKAAVLIESLIGNHPFVDGNKRTGIASGALLLRANGYRLTLSHEALERLALGVATGETSAADLANALRVGSVALDRS
jgi:death on curing protein